MLLETGLTQEQAGQFVFQENSLSEFRLIGFECELRWVGMLVRITDQDFNVARTAIGYNNRRALREIPEFQGMDFQEPTGPERSLVDRMKQYASGISVEFSDIQLDTAQFSKFRERVSWACRQIPYGETVTYGELAALAGSPRAARAVGSVMSSNPFPIIVPCHRVVSSNGKLGGFSAPDGPELKKWLLTRERNSCGLENEVHQVVML